jgi:MFS family permease
MVNLFDSALMFVPPLLFYHGTYQCQELTSDHCTQFVCSLDPSERKQYLPDAPFHSLAHQLDLDFQCEHAGTLTLFSSLVFIGSIGGMLIFSTFTERIGRKSSLTLSLAIMAVGLLLTYLGGLLQSIPLIVCGMLLTYCGCENGYQYVYCFSTEVVAEEWRISYINLLNVIYGLGMVIDALVFYYIKEWTQIYLYVFIVPAVLTLVAVMAVIEKTPMDMLSSETETEVMARLQRIASINNK